MEEWKVWAAAGLVERGRQRPRAAMMAMMR
jgi:hypothetical protein